jgi:hypothetical protein
LVPGQDDGRMLSHPPAQFGTHCFAAVLSPFSPGTPIPIGR